MTRSASLCALVVVGILAAMVLASPSSAVPTVAPPPLPREVGSIVYVRDAHMRFGGPTYATDSTLVGPAEGTDPQWSPDGTQIAFRAPDHGIHTTYDVGLGERTVTSGGDDSQAAWSPDGTAIAFTRVVTQPMAGTDVFRVNVDGTGLRRLTTTSHASSPAWTSEATIAYADDTPSTGGLFTMAADGSGAGRIASGAASYDDLDASPDGTRLAYAGGDGIHTVGADGTRDAHVSTGALDSSPSWSPGGQDLVFAAHQFLGRPDLVVVAADGTDPRGVAPGEDAPTQPDWGPVVPTSLAVFRGADADGYYVRGHGRYYFGSAGRSEDVPLPDRVGFDGRAIGFYRPSTSTFVVPDVATGGNAEVRYGRRGDVPVPTGLDDDSVLSKIAVFRPSDGTWYRPGQAAVPFGRSGDRPVPAFYRGGSEIDLAVFRPSNGTWYVRGEAAVPYGRAGDVPVPADYLGAGKAGVAVFRPSDGTWYVRGASPVSFGRAGDIPLPGDYIGDGTTQLAVYRPSDHTFYVRGLGSAAYGRQGDVPVPGTY